MQAAPSGGRGAGRLGRLAVVVEDEDGDAAAVDDDEDGEEGGSGRNAKAGKKGKRGALLLLALLPTRQQESNDTAWTAMLYVI